MKRSIILLLLFLFALPPAAPGADDAESAGEPPGPEVAALWQSLYDARFTPDAPGCPYDYGPKGMRNVYCYVSRVLEYEDFIEAVGRPAFVAGPHTPSRLKLDSPYSFGHYDPDFVRLVTERFLPSPDQEKFIWMTQPLYERLFKPTARIYYLMHRKAAARPGWLEKEAARYRKMLEEKRLDKYWFLSYESLSDKQIEEHLGGDYYYVNAGACAVAFWVRREVDRTRDEFFDGLLKALQAYDPTFLRREAAGAAEEPAVRPFKERVAVYIEDRLLRIMLDRLTAAAEEHDWGRVLTFFDPDNFVEQTEVVGVPPEQYIAEGLGLPYHEEGWKPAGDSERWPKLDAVRTMTITDAGTLDPSGRRTVRGRVELRSGLTFELMIFLRRLPTGRWIIEPALG